MESPGQDDATEPPPTRCSKCGHEFAPNTPDPFWCPQCGRLWSRSDSLLLNAKPPTPQSKPGEPPPVELTATERSRYRLAFVILLVGTPVAMFGMVLSSASTWQWIPKVIRDTGIFTYGILPMLGTLVLGCVAAGYCLTRLRKTGESGWNMAMSALGYAILMFFVYLAISFVGCAVLVNLSR